jgi:crossover junction endodeoxyribonuclease RuvC
MTSTPDAAIRILGIDPGTNITGYGVVAFAGRDPMVIEAGAIRTTAKAELASRITQIYTDLCEILDEHSPDIVAVEQLYSHYAHPRTAITMGHARGVILLACEQRGIPVRHLSATQIKKSLTGNGQATKQQMQRAVQSVCKLDEPPTPADVADAIAIALCAGRRVK